MRTAHAASFLRPCQLPRPAPASARVEVRQCPGVFEGAVGLAFALGREEKTKDVPVIFLTGERKEKHHKNIGSQLGAVEYLLKPVEVDVLRNAVRQQLSK